MAVATRPPGLRPIRVSSRVQCSLSFSTWEHPALRGSITRTTRITPGRSCHCTYPPGNPAIARLQYFPCYSARFLASLVQQWRQHSDTSCCADCYTGSSWIDVSRGATNSNESWIPTDVTKWDSWSCE